MIDKSLSRGLADRVLDEMAERAGRYPRHCRLALDRIPQRRQAVKSIAHSLKVAGDVACLTQVISAHAKWRWASICAFLPNIVRVDGRAERTIFFCTVRVYCHVDRAPAVTFEPKVVLAVQEHAVERLFQRLNVMDAAAVREELHDAMCLAVPLRNACIHLGLRQCVLSTRSGAFLCSIESAEAGLVAKTWIAKAEESARHARPAAIAKEYLIAAGGDQGIGLEIGSLPINVRLCDIPAPEALITALDRIDWLKEPYERRPDPVGRDWASAKQQRDAA